MLILYQQAAVVSDAQFVAVDLPATVLKSS